MEIFEFARILESQTRSIEPRPYPAAAVDRMREEHLLSKPVADHLQQRFEDWIDLRSQHIFRMVADDPSLAEANVRLVQREIGNSQKRALLRLLQRGVISEEVYSEYTERIDDLLRSATTMDWVLSTELRETVEGTQAAEGEMEQG